MARARAAFLDRDGVLIRTDVRGGRPHPVATVAELELLPGVVEACGILRGAGLRLLCVTNQPDIARGVTTGAAVDEQNEWLASTLRLDAVLVCPHDDADACSCRKPLPGLLVRGAEQFGIDLGRSVMVGDRWRDIEAGRAAGCHTVFIDNRYDERQPVSPDLTVRSLLEATPWMLEAVDPQRPEPREHR
ncbi:MAG: histidinol-phosphate phosphatase family protein [Actinomycetia bacterium]|nr:histidinol-phosphate phosphatase family protein [Actinomycetes bacterium]